MKFYKVSYEQFKSDLLSCLKENYQYGLLPQRDTDSKLKEFFDEYVTEDIIKGIYNNIQLPKRATIGSAGYDFFVPVPIELNNDVQHTLKYCGYNHDIDVRIAFLISEISFKKSLPMFGKTVRIPTGIRAEIDNGWMLSLYPRSGLGFKYRVQLDNTVGIIDSDYFYSDNEGHIMAKITIDKDNDTIVNCGLKAGQGFIQGIFIQYGLIDDDITDGIRNGGFGSTTK